MGRIQRETYKVHPTASPLGIHIGLLVLRMRAERKWTITNLAVRAGLSRAFICDMENGFRSCGVETVWKLSKAFGVSPACFFDGFKD